jgi:hypothetical protein
MATGFLKLQRIRQMYVCGAANVKLVSCAGNTEERCVKTVGNEFEGCRPASQRLFLPRYVSRFNIQCLKCAHLVENSSESWKKNFKNPILSYGFL